MLEKEHAHLEKGGGERHRAHGRESQKATEEQAANNPAAYSILDADSTKFDGDEHVATKFNKKGKAIKKRLGGGRSKGAGVRRERERVSGRKRKR